MSISEALDMHLQYFHQKSKGFSLIELLIALAVIGILAAIALPNYTEHVKRGHRASAKSALAQLGQWMERAATASGSYPAAAAVPSGLLVVEGGRYTLVVTTTGGGTAYELSAEPIGGQVGDRCGTYVVDQAQRRTLKAATASVAECWDR